ncbi:MAG: hypothetical protein M3483_07935, partial [Gemmatimonadota bacterium]|nr:hypothetical protein [Gemmatimonadota bacterium]
MSLSPRRIFIRLAGRLAAPLTFGAFALFGGGDLFAQIPPDAGWRTFDTENFRVHYTRGLEELARRAGERGETAYRELSAALVAPPRGKIDLLVADNVDFANGYATPLPTNRVVIYAHPPVGEPSLAFYDDWLELVITHELAHVFHLDYAGSVYRPLRSVFGRAPFLFPSVLVPGWVIEGLATHLESELTRSGRVRGTMHDMALRTAILQDAFFSIDRATGSPVTWPGGSTRYIYGSLFIAHLAERYGEEKVGEFVRAVGGSFIPYRLNAAAERSFGISFTRAWEEWEAQLRARYLPLAAALRRKGLTEPEILTPAGRYASFPRFSPEGTRISYAASTGRDDRATRVIYLVSDEDRVALRRTTLGPAGWLAGGDSLLIAQLEFTDPYRIYSDLYRTSSRDDEEVRITEHARLSDPDPSRDGLRAAVVESTGGSNVPAILDLRSATTRRLAEPSLDVHWALPRFSPRGDRVAVSRWRSGGFYDIVILDTTGRILQELTADRAVDASPAWSPDGEYIVFSSDRTGISNLYAYHLAADSLWQVTNVLTGAFQPDVSPDARWIVFSLYAEDGYHIARIPFEPETWRPAPSLRPQLIVEESADYTATAGGPDRPYSPWRSLAPAAWSPYLDGGTELGVGIGAATGGQDLVGRHAYGGYALLYPRDSRAE